MAGARAWHTGRGAWALLAIGALAACSESPAPGSAAAPERVPNVVLVSVDTLRADALGAYGGPVPTPAFDALAREGVLFEAAFAPAPRTAASHATLFTGRRVPGHGVLDNGWPLSDEVTTLAEAFRARGYRTASFVSSFVLDPRFGWCQGFDHCDAEFPKEGETWPADVVEDFWTGMDFDGFDRRAHATTAAAKRWLETTEGPFFLFVHYYDPHAPYKPPPKYRKAAPRGVYDLKGRSSPELTDEWVENLIRLYHAEVSYIDDEIGSLLAAVEAASARPRLTVVTADHGEGLGEHRHMFHSDNLYQELLRVPLVFHSSGEKLVPRRIGTPVTLADVAPTLAALAGLPPLVHADGVSLAASVRQGVSPPERPVHAQRIHKRRDGSQAHAYAVREGRWKLIVSPVGRGGLFDLEIDPDEERDVSSAHPDVVARLATSIESTARRAADTPAPALDPETREGLEALGYAQ